MICSKRINREISDVQQESFGLIPMRNNHVISTFTCSFLQILFQEKVICVSSKTEQNDRIRRNGFYYAIELDDLGSNIDDPEAYIQILDDIQMILKDIDGSHLINESRTAIKGNLFIREHCFCKPSKCHWLTFVRFLDKYTFQGTFSNITVGQNEVLIYDTCKKAESVMRDGKLMYKLENNKVKSEFTLSEFTSHKDEDSSNTEINLKQELTSEEDDF